MPYIGRAATNTGNVRYLDNVASGFDGSDVTFTAQVGGVSITPDQENVRIYLDGVFQHPGSGNAYTISGSTITFEEAPVANTVFSAYVVGAGSYLDDKAVSSAKLDDDAVTAAKLDDDGTGFQVGDLGVGGSLTSGDKLTVTGRARVSGGIIGDLTGDVTGDTSGSSGSTTGNAATATALATARAINGVNFDGSAAITVTADANTLTNTTLKSTVVSSSLTSVGTLTTLTVDDITINGSTISDSGDLTIDTEADLTLTALSDIIHQSTSTNSTAGHHIFKSYNTEIMRIDGANNRVGIGTTSPSAFMHINSAGVTDLGVVASACIHMGNSTASNATNLITMGNSGGTNGCAYMGYLQTDGGGNTKGSLIFGTRDSTSDVVPTERMRIKSNGEVQFSTAAAIYHYGAGRFLINDAAGSASEPTYSFNSDTDTGMYRPAANQLAFTTDGTQALIFGGDQTATFNNDVTITSANNPALFITSTEANTDNFKIYIGGTGLSFYNTTDSKACHFKHNGDWDFGADGATVNTKTWGNAEVTGLVGIGISPSTYALKVDNIGNAGIFAGGVVSASSFDDRTPYPETLDIAQKVLKSHKKLSDYDADDQEKQLDHSKLHEYVKTEHGRNVSAVVSCLVETVNDLMDKVTALENA